MSKKKWLIVIGAAAALSVLAVGLVAVGLGIVFFAGPQIAGAEAGSPSYKLQQTASAHPGYLRTTLTSGNATYVSDYEEYGLELLDLEPHQVIGHYGLGGKVCAISGQPSTAYIAVDEGSEMPAYAVFRNTGHAPFDWRKATFSRMQLTRPVGRSAVLRSSDPAILAEVIRTIRDGAAAVPHVPVATALANQTALLLYSDELPGLVFSPAVYFQPTGAVYLSENISIQPSKANTTVNARWVLVEGKLADWLNSQ
jgi:hypothetical protein